MCRALAARAYNTIVLSFSRGDMHIIKYVDNILWADDGWVSCLFVVHIGFFLLYSLFDRLVQGHKILRIKNNNNNMRLLYKTRMTAAESCDAFGTRRCFFFYVFSGTLTVHFICGKNAHVFWACKMRRIDDSRLRCYIYILIYGVDN